jgi:hypothetical protein
LPSTSVTLAGITALTGGGTALDAVSIAPYSKGTLVNFTFDDVLFVYEVRDEAELPVEDIGWNVVPNTPSGTKYWGLHYSVNCQPSNGESFLGFGSNEVSALSFDGTGVSAGANGFLMGSSQNGVGTQHALTISPTWNAGSTTMSAIYSRVTDTASNAASKILDLGTSAGGQLLALSKTGDLTGKTFKPEALVANGTAGAGYLEFAEQSGVPTIVATKLRMYENSSDELVINYDDHNPGGPDNPAISFRSLVNGTRRYTFPNFGTQLMQYDSDLNALANNSSNGLWAHVSAGFWCGAHTDCRVVETHDYQR